MAATLREATPNDAAAIAGIYNEYILHTTYTFEIEPLSELQMRQRMESIVSSYPYYVCEEKGQICGFCYAHPFHERAAFRHTLESTVYLARGAEGRGLGKMMMQTLIRECRRRGYHVLLACITSENETSLRFHESLGFTRCAHFHEVGYKFDRWIGVIDYEIIL